MELKIFTLTPKNKTNTRFFEVNYCIYSGSVAVKYSVKGGLEIEIFYWFKNENLEKNIRLIIRLVMTCAYWLVIHLMFEDATK